MGARKKQPVTLFLTWVIAVLQFGWLLITRERNANLAAFGGSLSTWAASVVRFVSCTSEEKPFPWAPWPKASEGAGAERGAVD